MTSIVVEQAGTPLSLHSCPACGRHAWLSDGAEVDRAELLAALKAAPATPRRAGSTPSSPSSPSSSPSSSSPPGGDSAIDVSAGEPREEARRAELRAMLQGFVVHGTSS